MASAGAVALSLLPGCTVERQPFLVVKDGQGREVARMDLPDGRFSHVFTHSFHLTPVEELMEVEADGSLLLYELRYQSCGVGMPTEAEDGFRLEDGVFVLAMSRLIRRISVMVSPLPGHGIRVVGHFYPFRDWAEAGEPLVLSGGTRLKFHVAGR